MNTEPAIPVTLTRAYTHPCIVSIYGFPMEVEYDYIKGEPTIYWPTERAHPGCPTTVELLACKVNGQDIIDMLSSDQMDRIEENILEQLEG
jgi:hypothetical protein